MYENGFGVDKNYLTVVEWAPAVEWDRKEAEQGNSGA